MAPDNFMNFFKHNTHKPGVITCNLTRKFYLCFLFSKFCTLYSLFYPLRYDCWELLHLHSAHHYFFSRQQCIIESVKSHYRQIASSNPCTGLDRPWGFQEADSTWFQDIRHMNVVRLSATLAAFTPQEICLVFIVCYRLSQPHGHSTDRRITVNEKFQ